MSRRYRLPEPIYRFVADRLVGRFLLYSFRRELHAGNLHEARHVAAAVQVGNSEPCDRGAPCLLDGGAMKLPTSLPTI